MNSDHYQKTDDKKNSIDEEESCRKSRHNGYGAGEEQKECITEYEDGQAATKRNNEEGNDASKECDKENNGVMKLAAEKRYDYKISYQRTNRCKN